MRAGDTSRGVAWGCDPSGPRASVVANASAREERRRDRLLAARWHAMGV